MSLSLAALLVAFVLLALVRTLRSNLHSIHRNLIGALFSSQLVFVIGVTQTGNPVRPLPPSPAPPPRVWPCDLSEAGAVLTFTHHGASGGCSRPALGSWESPASQAGLLLCPGEVFLWGRPWEPHQKSWGLQSHQLLLS